MEDSAIGVASWRWTAASSSRTRPSPTCSAIRERRLEALTFFQITHPEDVAIGSETMQRVRAGEADSYQFEKRYLRKNGTPVWARLSGSVIRDSETGAPLYLVSQIEDIDARKQAEARIAEAETRWNFALASAGPGRVGHGHAQGRHHLLRHLGRRCSATKRHELDGDPDRWLTMIHPDDQELVAEADRAHLAGKTAILRGRVPDAAQGRALDLDPRSRQGRSSATRTGS